MSIEDITPFVELMRDSVVAGGAKAVEHGLLTPLDKVAISFKS